MTAARYQVPRLDISLNRVPARGRTRDTHGGRHGICPAYVRGEVVRVTGKTFAIRYCASNRSVRCVFALSRCFFQFST